MSQKVVVDCSTGEITQGDLSAQEQSELDARIADGQREMQVAAQVATNRSTLQDAARAALAANRAYLQRPNSEKTAAVVRDQVDALTRQQNRVIRLLLGVLDGVD